MRYLQDYLKHDLDEKRVRESAEHLEKTLKETLPARQIVEGQPSGELAAEHDTGYLARWLDTLVKGKRILQNSYILSYNIKNRNPSKE